jgi:hypothetical protein
MAALAQPPGHQRLAGAHGDLPEGAPHPQPFGDLADQIVIADRGAADGHDQIGALGSATANGRAASSVSRAMGNEAGPRRPAASAIAASAKSFEAMIWLGRGVSPGITSSSPVAIMATHRAARHGDRGHVHRRDQRKVIGAQRRGA